MQLQQLLPDQRCRRGIGLWLFLLYILGTTPSCFTILEHEMSRAFSEENIEKTTKAQISSNRDAIRRTPVIQHLYKLEKDNGVAADVDLRSIELYLNSIGDEVYQLAKGRYKHRASKYSPKNLRPFRVKLDPEAPPTYVLQTCTPNPQVIIPLSMVHALALDAAKYSMSHDYSIFQSVGMGELGRQFGQGDIKGFMIAMLPPTSKPTNDMSELTLVHTSGRAQLEYMKSLSFLIAHEASHIWYDNCAPQVGRQRELGQTQQIVVGDHELDPT